MGACAMFTYLNGPEEGSEGPGTIGFAFYPPGMSAPWTLAPTEAVVLLLANDWSSLFAGHLPPFQSQSAPSMPLGLVIKIYCKSSGLKQQGCSLSHFLRPGI